MAVSIILMKMMNMSKVHNYSRNYLANGEIYPKTSPKKGDRNNDFFINDVVLLNFCALKTACYVPFWRLYRIIQIL